MASAYRVRLSARDPSPVRLRVEGDGSATFASTEYIPYRVTDYRDYDGPYEIVPRLSEQTLETTERVMRDDVTVEGIPSYRTTNLGGGYTVVIAQD